MNLFVTNLEKSSSSKPAILIIGPLPPPYHGVSVSTQLILQSPILQDFRLIHLDTTDRRSIANIGQFDFANIFLGLEQAMQYLWLLLRHRPALVYVPISQGTAGYLRDLSFLLPARWLHLPVVVHLRGSEFRQFYQSTSGLMQKLIRYSLGKVRKVIVLGESLRAIFAGLIPPDRIAVIPNGEVDFVTDPSLLNLRWNCSNDFSRSDPRNDDFNRSNGVIGLYLSNLRCRKGVLVTMEAAIAAMQRHPNLRFVFAGEYVVEEERLQVEALQKAANLGERLLLPGIVTGEAKLHLLLESDFLVFPPIEPEGHPRVILEAMAAGLPVISTPQGAIPETVLDGQTGFLVPPGDANALQEKIELLVENPHLRRRLGEAARQRFLEHYTADRANIRLVALFHEVLEES